MIAHSFHGHPSFGPAGGMVSHQVKKIKELVRFKHFTKPFLQHGATYTCDVEFGCNDLNPETNWVLDIGQASQILSEVLSKYNLKNMDEVFPNGELTTTEFMSKKIHEDIAARLRTECTDFSGEVCVKLWESHTAWASYTGKI